jgi:hypothetical protein
MSDLSQSVNDTVTGIISASSCLLLWRSSTLNHCPTFDLKCVVEAKDITTAGASP